MKVLVVEPDSKAFLGTNDGFIKAGYEVKIIKFSSGIEKQRYITRLKNKLGFDISKYLSRKRDYLNQQIIDTYNCYRPDIVLIRQGRHILPETVQQIAEKAFVVLALSDMISLFPDIPATFPYYDVIYSYDRADIAQLQDAGFKAKFKPAGYNKYIYHKENAEKNCDISFVGTMYPERITVLKQLVKTFPTMRWEIYGEYAPLRTPLKWLNWRFSSEYKYFRNKYLNPVDVNDLYNRSKIVLNIVRANQRDGWSSRLLQIAGAGAFQITDYFDAVEKEFDGCVCLFKTYNELVERIAYYLDHDDARESIAKRGYDKVINDASSNLIVKMVMDDYYKKGTDTDTEASTKESMCKSNA